MFRSIIAFSLMFALTFVSIVPAFATEKVKHHMDCCKEI